MRTAIALLLCLLAGCGAPTKPEPIWIGHLAPLSGTEGERGEEAVRAMQTVLTKARDEDFTITGRPVGVRHVDSAKGDARAEAIRLMAVNRVAALIVGPGVSNLDDILAASRAHPTPVIVLDEVATPPDTPGVYLLGPDPVQRGEAAARYLSETRELTRVGLVVDRKNAIHLAVADAFERAWRDRKGELRRWEAESVKDEEVKQFAPEALVRATRPTEPKLWRPSVESLLIGDDDALPPKSVHELTLTIYTPKADLPGIDTDTLKPVRRDGQSPGRDAVLALDGLRFILEGIKTAGSPLRLDVRKALDGLRGFDSVTGKMTWTQGRPVRRLFVLRGGKVVETIEPKE